MPFARTLALLSLALSAPAAHAQRGLVARSYAEVDTTQDAMLRALIATADSVGLRLALDSVDVGVLNGTQGRSRVRLRLTRTDEGRTAATAATDYGRSLPDERERLNVQWHWLQAAASALFGAGGPDRLLLFSLVALNPAVPVCALSGVELDPARGDRPPVITLQVPAAYPDKAWRENREGAVIVAATVNEAGRVTCAGAVSAMPFGFSDAAVLAVSKWQFTPAIFNGRPKAVTIFLPVRFRTRG